MKIVAISGGRKNGNNEVLLKEAMMAAMEVADVEPVIKCAVKPLALAMGI